MKSAFNKNQIMHYIVVMIALSLLASCSKSPPEEQILTNIKSMQQGLKERKTSKAIEYLAEDFSGNHGVDKKSLRQVLIGQFLQHQNINVVITRMDITVPEHDPYQAVMEGVVIATGAKRILSQDGRIYKVQGDWRYVNDEWLLVRLQWE